ncbi:unnamed protein product, partial [marine sediment metagenome]
TIKNLFFLFYFFKGFILCKIIIENSDYSLNF